MPEYFKRDLTWVAINLNSRRQEVNLCPQKLILFSPVARLSQ